MIFQRVLFAFLLFLPAIAIGQEEVEVSPREPWRDLEARDSDNEQSLTSKILLWLPNRVLDLIDVLKLDVGVGPMVGGVVRVTKYGQVGFRGVAPATLRVGAMGRRAPVMIERANEMGIGPAFLESPDRIICAGELGVGLDLVVVGAYGGVCVDELADFVAGIFGADFKDDDLVW